MTTSLRAVILIVSETASKDPSTDKSGPTLKNVFDAAATESVTWDVEHVAIVPDDVSAIQRTIQQWSDKDKYANLIVTSGGTGFATKDVTPEAVSPLLHKHASGLVHAMLATSLSVTPFAMMARPLAGVRNSTLILTLPGSPKGAKENLEAVIKLLAHACQQAAGADSRTIHAKGIKKLEQEAGVSSSVQPKQQHNHSHDHHHHHHHGHGGGHGHGHQVPRPRTDPSSRPQPNDPNAPPTLRNRSSPYAMLSVADALSLIATNTPEPSKINVPLTPAVIGSVLASSVKANEAVPAYRASIVDGYAVRLPCAAGVYRVSQISHAQGSDSVSATLEQGTVARITTGAPLPEGADAVVMVEDTVIASTTEDGKEEATIEILTSALETGENVREVGSDVAQGSTIMAAGEGISALGGEYALLASTGTRSVSVYARPVVGVLSTGDELVAHDHDATLQPLRRGQVRDTNRPSLLAAARAMGFEAVDLGVAADAPGALEAKLREGLSRVDVLVSSGGVSMGELDLLKPTVERALGGTIHFGRVSMKPGKPTTFATVDVKDVRCPSSSGASSSDGNNAAGEAAGEGGAAAPAKRRTKLIFALPGNPASALVTFLLFALPALQRLSGVKPANGLPRVRVRIAEGERIRCDDKRQEYVRAVVVSDLSTSSSTVAAAAASGAAGAGPSLVARSTGGQRSSRVGSFRGANALLVMPVRTGYVEGGDEVEALLMGDVLAAAGPSF